MLDFRHREGSPPLPALNFLSCAVARILFYFGPLARSLHDLRRIAGQPANLLVVLRGVLWMANNGPEVRTLCFTPLSLLGRGGVVIVHFGVAPGFRPQPGEHMLCAGQRRGW